jgi:hypothetical protein
MKGGERERKQENSSVIAILRSVTGCELLYRRKANVRKEIQC